MTDVAALFPGQGSQEVGMGQGLAEVFRSAKDVFRRADDALGFQLSKIIWTGPADELKRTENAQPALLVHSYAVWSVLEDDLAGRVRFAAGHSLGEFSAYAAAGTLEFEDAVRLVRRRGELMAASPPGSMAAVIGLDRKTIDRICETVRHQDGVVVPANYNSPMQVVVSGELAAVERAAALAKEAGAGMVKLLEVSGAFHSPLMEDAEAGLRAELDRVTLRDPEFPVVSNVTAKPVTDARMAHSLLISQLTSPVRWSEGVKVIAREGVREFVELGPGKVLTGLLRRIDPALNCAAIGRPADIERLRETET
ncbi:MAG: ACP S-malonyltransferase [Gemmatimonadota bacterium]